MICGFNFEPNEKILRELAVISNGSVDGYYSSFKRESELLRVSVSKSEKYINDNGVIRADILSAEWFPQICTDVFISHSHKDEHMALALAGWLSKELQLRVFVDSVVWKSADSLLKKIDDKFCVLNRNEDGSVKDYNYSERNSSTAHIHLMLSCALIEMMAKSKIVLFLNTENSIVSSEIGKGVTDSPWIYEELILSKYLQGSYGFIKESRVVKDSAQLQVHYPVNMKHLKQLTTEKLISLYVNSVRGDKCIETLIQYCCQ